MATFFKPDSGGLQVSRENWKRMPNFFLLIPKEVIDFLETMEAETSFNRPFDSCSMSDKGQIGLASNHNYEVSFSDRSYLDVLGLKNGLQKR